MTRYVIKTINRCLDFLLHCYTLPLLSLVNSNCSFRNCQTTSQASSGDTGQGEERRINIQLYFMSEGWTYLLVEKEQFPR